MLPPGSRLLVAVSGGADSTALLVGLARLGHEHGLQLHAAHLHHGLRGLEADTDLASVRALCETLGVPLIAARWKAAARMKRRGLTGQAGLRMLRGEFLAAAAGRCGAAAIATAHTADDQLETLLMRLLRGTGLAGLGGMSPRRGRWVKPLLEVTRAEIESDLRQARIAWREDASNRDPAYLRNRLRHRAIPALLAAGTGKQRAGAGARAALARRAVRAAAELREAQTVLRMMARRIPKRVARLEAGEIALDSVEVQTYPYVVQRTLLQQLWRRLGHGLGDLTSAHLDGLTRLLDNPRSRARVDLPRGWIAECDRRMVRFRKSEPTGARARSRAGESNAYLTGRGNPRS